MIGVSCRESHGGPVCDGGRKNLRNGGYGNEDLSHEGEKGV